MGKKKARFYFDRISYFAMLSDKETLVIISGVKLERN